ncbi:MAG: circadian clock KaiB family protein [Halofilum sp. (in: g-proteobacteria)]|nr:circadian clock KaiB family protein [Halofilum sp. (in: g-proteobacteria)]
MTARASPLAMRETNPVQQPEQDLSHGIFATPALVRVSAGDRSRVLYGDLSETQRLRHFLAEGTAPAESAR